MTEASATKLTVPEEQAFQLSQAAIKIDQARQESSRERLVDALNENLEVWVALRSLVMRNDCTLPVETIQNLAKLSEYVAEKTFMGVDELKDATLDSLVNINLQISEGLLEGVSR